MYSIIISAMLLGSFTQNPNVTTKQVATMPKELNIPTVKPTKRSRGKGQGQPPYFAKYFK